MRTQLIDALIHMKQHQLQLIMNYLTHLLLNNMKETNKSFFKLIFSALKNVLLVLITYF